MRKVCLTLLLLVAGAAAQDSPGDKSPIRLPAIPSSPQPPPAPPSSDVAVLTGNSLYIVDSDVALICLLSPLGLAAISEYPGPIVIKSVFVDSNGKSETRTYKGPHVYAIEAVATGRVELLIVPVGATTEKAVIRRLIDCQVGPRPPPPDPDPKPPDPKPPTPGPVTDMRVLIVYESAHVSKMPAAQQSVLYAKSVRDYLNAHCVTGPDGKTKEYRIYDQDVDLTAEAPPWKDLMSRPRASVPWLVISGKAGVAFEGPLPPTVDETLALLKKYGGP